MLLWIIKDLQGSSVESQNCHEGPCAAWTNWGAYGECSSICGGGVKTKVNWIEIIRCFFSLSVIQFLH